MTLIDKAFEQFDPLDMFIINVKSRLIKHTRIDSNGCWIWTGSLDNCGYGLIGLNKKLVTVHRLSAKIFLGLDLTRPYHLQALHKNECHRKNCWNPNHLYVGTPQDNVRDSIDRRTHNQLQNKYQKDIT